MSQQRIKKTKQPPNYGPLRELLAQLKGYRKQAEDLKDNLIPDTQREALTALAKLDPEDHGVVFEFEGQELTGHYQQNEASEFWDTEELIPFLKKSKARWMACSSRVFDPAKFEAEVANGNIPPKTVAKFKKTGNPPSPFVRWGKPKKDSLR